jgi:hypothetical protein
MILVAFRHGLRACELTDLRWDQIDFSYATLHVRRVKSGTPSTPDPWRRNARAPPATARAGAEVAVCVHVRTRIAVLDVGLCQARGTCRRGGQAWLSCPPAHAAPRLRLRVGQQGARYASPAGLSQGIGTSSIRCATPSCRPIGSKISGRAEAGTTDTVPAAVRSSNTIPTVVRSSFR